jgi:outer membrane lipoprotein SlyB
MAMIRGILGAAALGGLLAACASGPSGYERTGYAASPSYPAYSNVAYSGYGQVVAIDVVRGEGHGSTSGAGAVLGGIAGGVLGHQVGSGRGNTAATVAGAVGGAYAGNEVEKRRDERNGNDLYRITVRFEDGHESTFTQDSLSGIRVGDRVRVDRDRLVRD